LTALGLVCLPANHLDRRHRFFILRSDKL